MIIKQIIIFLIFISNIYAINISELSKNENILNQTSIFFDEYNIEDIESIPEQNFIKFPFDKIDYGFTKGSIWLKFSISNDSSKKISKNLYFDNFAINKITLYEEHINSYLEYNDGLHKDKKFSNIIRPNFEINLDVYSSKNYYLKVSSFSTALQFKLYLVSDEDIYVKESTNQIILSLFFGALIALALYNIFIFFFTKELSYLFYVLYITGFSIFYAHHTGMYMFIFDEAIQYVNIKLLLIMTIFLLTFIKLILNIRKYKYLNYGIYAYISIFLTLFLLTSKNFYPIELTMLLILSSMLYIIFMCFYLINKSKEVSYIIIGWILAVFGFCLMVIKSFGIFDYTEYFPYIFEICIFLEATLFSMALASKLNRTSELQDSFERNRILTKELHHRVKNNMQFIVSMYRLKLSSEINEAALGKLKDVENTIYAMSKTHELLYSKNDLEYISTEEYFQELIHEIKNGYNTEDIDITIDISVDLNLKDAINCGIILNEAITNCFKYAFSNNKGHVHIKIAKIIDKNIFIIEDNGVGFTQEHVSDSFGLLLMKSLVSDELKGNFLIESNYGTRIIIEF